MAMVSSATRIAGERTSGWTRQLRITPLTARAYFRAKILTAYAMAASSIAVLFGLPSSWLVQASHISFGEAGWSATGWIVVGVWTVVPARLARFAYRRDTRRV